MKKTIEQITISYNSIEQKEDHIMLLRVKIDSLKTEALAYYNWNGSDNWYKALTGMRTNYESLLKQLQ